tara:strand:+ start:285 stop:467 length:183 start_codon:yes stop_codon:yes gene_type:complete
MDITFDITSAKYNAWDKQNQNIDCVINNELITVPIDPNNRHYQALLKWVADGNTIEEEAD